MILVLSLALVFLALSIYNKAQQENAEARATLDKLARSRLREVCGSSEPNLGGKDGDQE